MDINSLKIKVINSVTHSRGLERVQCRSQTKIHRNKCPLFIEWVNLLKQNWGLGRMVGFTLWLRDLQKLANPYTYQSKIIWVWCQMTREGVCGQVGLSLQKWVRQYCSGSYCHCVQNISTPFLLPAILPMHSCYIVTNLFCRVPAGHFCLATANLPVRSQSLKQKKEWYDLSFDGWKNETLNTQQSNHVCVSLNYTAVKLIFQPPRKNISSLKRNHEYVREVHVCWNHLDVCINLDPTFHAKWHHRFDFTFEELPFLTYAKATKKYNLIAG